MQPQFESMKPQCIIVEDDLLDRMLVQSYVKRSEGLDFRDSFASAEEAIGPLQTNPADILFLDIDMPGMSGLDLRRMFPQVPVCIFITSHPEHALEGFETQAFDFMVKPISWPRFESTVARAQDYLTLVRKAALVESVIGENSILLREGNSDVRIDLSEVMFLEALGNYTRIGLSGSSHYILNNLGNLLKESTFQAFVRVHRSFAIQKYFVSRFNSKEVELADKTLVPVGRVYKNNLDQFR